MGAVFLSHHSCATCGHRGHGLLDGRDSSLSGEEAGSDGRRVLKSASGNLCGIEDSCLDHINILFLESIEADTLLGLTNLVNDNASVKSCVSCDVIKRSFESLEDYSCTGLLITRQAVHVLGHCRNSCTKRYAAAADDTFYVKEWDINGVNATLGVQKI